MIRIITRTTDSGEACNVGGPIHTRHNTWEVHNHPALEQHLKSTGQYITREIVGFEVVDE